MSTNVQIPRTKWSEDKKNCYVTVELSNTTDRKVDIQAKQLHVTATSNKIPYDIKLELAGEIDPEQSSYAVKGPSIEILLHKKEEGRWNKLTANKNAYKQQLHVDWDKWIDEDEEDKPPAGLDNFGQGGDMGGMGGMANMMGGGGGGAGGFDPAMMQQMMAGMGGGGAGGMGGFDPSQFEGMGGEEDEADSDDELPDLETTEDAESAGKSAASSEATDAKQEEQKA